jgi:uncharacterized protein YceK
MLGAMIRFILSLAVAGALLSGCGVVNRLRGVPDSNPSPGVDMATEIAPAVDTTVLPGAQSAEALDQTTEAERAAATAAPAAATERELGRVVVGLGPVTEQGFWLKSTLVTEPAKGRVVTAAGTSVAVDLLPSDGGATLSLAAFRALELSLTELPEVVVYVN